MSTPTEQPRPHTQRNAGGGWSGFNGQRLEPRTGHYLLGSGYRAYNPVLMHFNNPDALSPFARGGLNAYAYCLGDPVNLLDPDGHAGVMKWLRMIFQRAKMPFVSRPRGAKLLHNEPGSSSTLNQAKLPEPLTAAKPLADSTTVDIGKTSKIPVHKADPTAESQEQLMKEWVKKHPRTVPVYEESELTIGAQITRASGYRKNINVRAPQNLRDGIRRERMPIASTSRTVDRWQK